ncbi:MAG: hypothetical protein LC659_07435 [Myxococcales bacterium]|nr:hypothetical protein [Myxococcales bacterium]
MHSAALTHSCVCVPVHDAAQAVELKNFLPLVDVPMSPQHTLLPPQSAAWPHSNVFAVESVARQAAVLETQLLTNPPSVLESQQTGVAPGVVQAGPL